MRLPRTIRLLPCAVALLVSAWSARGQYSGGVSGADGYAAAGAKHLRLDGSPMLSPAYTASAGGGDGYSSSGSAFNALNGGSLPAALFTATSSGGDGYSAAGRQHVPLDGSLAPSQLYTASAAGGDGYAVRGLLNRQIDGAAAPMASYTGGAGDGYDSSGFENVFVNPDAAVLVIYTGGSSGGDGYDFDGIRHSRLGGDGAAVEIYSAGASGGDGYDNHGRSYVRLDGIVPPVELYTASDAGGDGYDRAGVKFISFSGEAAIEFTYLGNGGDGYSLHGLRHNAINPALAPPAAIFAGDAGDGYDKRALPYVQNLGDDAAASPITFSGWLNSRFSEEEIAAGLAAPDADADFDGLGNLLEYAIGGDPRLVDASALGPQFRLSNLSEFGYPALPDHFLTALVHRNPLVLDAVLSVEVSSDLSSLWSTNETILVDSAPSAFLVRDQFGVKSDPHRNMRLRATLNP